MTERFGMIGLEVKHLAIISGGSRWIAAGIADHAEQKEHVGRRPPLAHISLAAPHRLNQLTTVGNAAQFFEFERKPGRWALTLERQGGLGLMRSGSRGGGHALQSGTRWHGRLFGLVRNGGALPKGKGHRDLGGGKPLPQHQAGFGMTDEQHSPGRKQAFEHGDGAVLCLRIEIDQQVAAEDDVINLAAPQEIGVEQVPL